MGQYQIVGLLGEGGMSQVFRAVDVNLGREVALKILHQSLSDDSSLTTMFEREAKLTASIVHPNVVKVFTVGREAGYFFIAMEVVNAISLEQLIINKGALNESEVLAIANDVTRGLMAAYSEELIHRDIKPGNMLVTSDGTTKLVDFGLAVQQGGPDESEDLWATPFYVPPEKLEGCPDTFIGDIYSLGATLFHALAGKPPFEANTASMDELKEIKKQRIDLKSLAPGLSKATVRLVEKMMAYDPADRFQSYEEVLEQIEEIRKRQFGFVPGGRVRGKKRRVLAWAVGVGALALTVLFAAGYFVGGDNLGEGDGDLGVNSGNGERVISAGEKTFAEEYLTARALLGEGKIRASGEAFDSLLANEQIPASIKIWSLFLRGTIHLWLGEAEASRQSFAAVPEINPEAGEVSAEVLDFLRSASLSLSDPLPLLEESVNFSTNSVASLGLLTAGLKNWQAGEFESGIRYLKAFAGSEPPAAYQWITLLKPRVDPFVKDFAVLESLPNPSASESSSVLAQQEELLKTASGSLVSPGAAPRLAKGRLERIAEIRRLASTVAAPPVTTVTSSDVGDRPSGMPTTDSPESNPAEKVELERIKTLRASLQSLASELRFDEAVAKLQAETFETESGKKLRDELNYGYGRAGEFIGVLADALTTSTYDGLVRRRTGIPLEAAITAATPTTFTLDLGFGPNEVPVSDLATDWLVEVAAKTFPSPSADSAPMWERLFYFGLMTGNRSAVESTSGTIGSFDPAFAGRWETVKRAF